MTRPGRAWLALAALLLFGDGAASTAHAHSPAEAAHALEGREQYFQSLDRSAPDLRLEDADRRAVSLADLRAKVVVLHFIYTHCPDVCPLHAEKIAAVQALVNKTNLRDRVQFVTITTDPVGDTPEIMRAYGGLHGLDSANWLFLTSGPDRPDATRSLAAAFGHRFDVGRDGLQMHGVVTHVIDRTGQLRGNFHGLEFQDGNLVAFLRSLAEDSHPPTTASRPASGSWWSRLTGAPASTR